MHSLDKGTHSNHKIVKGHCDRGSNEFSSRTRMNDTQIFYFAKTTIFSTQIICFVS